MEAYIDGFAFPIANQYLNEYQKIASQVGTIWKEYGAIAYYEFVGDDLVLTGTRSFADALGLNDDELPIFGWALFPSKEIRDQANKQVPLDPRMAKLVEPLSQKDRLKFDANRMLYGGFKSLVKIEDSNLI